MYFIIELLLLLLSRFSRVQLCETPETAAHQAPTLGGGPTVVQWRCHRHHEALLSAALAARSVLPNNRPATPLFSPATRPIPWPEEVIGFP